mmetsp:Transcript_45739/g.102832  ORF Transcript_45739/g.102832 Transcript_45739/m.102832 type:complete len:253 (-) Transcript_45739:42-800(-)
MLHPLSVFCCGCSVRFGAGAILLCHLAVCVFYVASACSTIIFHSPFFSSSWSYHAQLLYTAFSLIGLPTIAAAIWGVVERIEANIRLYLLYLVLSFLVDLVAMVYLCLVEDPCTSLKTMAASIASSSGSNWAGEAFVCGTFRIASYVGITVAVLIEVYCLWVIWSVCEDVHGGRNGPELSGLMPTKESVIQKSRRPPDGPYDSIVGFAHTKLPGAYPSPYGAISTSGMPGQSSIFGGSAHETDYPPRGGNLL